MSADPVSNTERIYIPLLNEGTPVVRPTTGVPLGGNTYRVLATVDYDPNDEHWQFPPGSVVRCSSEVKDGESVLIAKTLADQ
jgi:hypothetical protein